jgi:L-alanine-DL-glutamate epimerase-like enolase superfamily enzyme
VAILTAALIGVTMSGAPSTQAARSFPNLHAALAFGRTSFFEQGVPPEPVEFGVREAIRTGADGFAGVSEQPGLGIDIDHAAIEEATLGVVRAVNGGER